MIGKWLRQFRELHRKMSFPSKLGARLLCTCLARITDLPITLSLGTAAQEFRATRSPIRVSILCFSFCPVNCLMTDWITCLFRQPGQGGSPSQGRASGAAPFGQDPFESTALKIEIPSTRSLGVDCPPRIPAQLAEHDCNSRSPLFLPPSVSLFTSPSSLCQMLSWSRCSLHSLCPCPKGKVYCLLSHLP